jgi:AbrB family looped-hinge helix DNA binding protein
MEISVLAHWIGVLGEGLNLVGAAVLARDIFLRREEHERALGLKELSDFGQRNRLQSTTYKGILVSSPDLSLIVLQRYATRLAYWGLGFLGAGFLCLAIYHGLEIWDACHPKSERNISLDRIIGISDNLYFRGGTMFRPIMTKIAGKFQVTVPPEIRELFDLQEGDLLQWDFDEPSTRILLAPKRAQLITPVIRRLVGDVRAERAKEAVEKQPRQKVARAGSTG